MYDELLKRLEAAEQKRLARATDSAFEISDGCYTAAAAAIRDLTAKLEAANADCVTFRNAKNRAEEKADHLHQTLEAVKPRPPDSGPYQHYQSWMVDED